MTRSRLASWAGRWALVLVLAAGGPPLAAAQPGAETTREQPIASVPARAPEPATTPASNWSWVLGVLGGIALGVLGARWWARAPQRAPAGPAAISPVPPPKKRAENVVRPPRAAPSRPRPGNQAASDSSPKPAPKPAGSGGKSKNKSKSSSSGSRSAAWPTAIPQRTTTMNPTPPLGPPPAANKPLEPGQTVEWTAPPTTPPAIQELIDSTAGGASAAATPDPAPAAAPTGPVHYYAPAPDVPSIEHRKLSPNPLPQMPLLVTLPHAEATAAQFSFSPQADQSRIIGNGVRELKEFFAFELPPSEQFTTIRNITAGQLEKRDDAWHVVQKAEIALS